MPFIEINGARLYYQAFGRPQAGRAPIVLIHGSTITGSTDWEQVAPLLATAYHVIVPDCRGHGQSSNPAMTYSFSEMAADTAALVRALGYARAHIIGHSNGGNVALVTLVEHPDVVQTCIPQAANAYVSADLIEKEPRLFDPERVRRESPAWMEEMIALHGPTHGPEYWRDLLRLTVQAIISEPNYTPEILRQVNRPTLVIQGENDGVNAPAQHAQFIARHIPAAEVWLPAGAGHNVHKDLLFQWVQQVLDFLERRGSDPGDALYRLKRASYNDARETVFDLRLSAPSSPGGVFTLSGSVLAADQVKAALAVLPERSEAPTVRVLLTPETPYALVNRVVTDLRAAPDSKSERVSQALLGETVRVLDTRQAWCFVLHERYNYLGWINAEALHPCSASESQAYQRGCTAVVKAELLDALVAPQTDGRVVAGKLPFGLPVCETECQGDWAGLKLPDGRLWWVRRSELLPLDEHPRPDQGGIAVALQWMQRFVGVPYLWGGRTPFGYDCSSFVGILWGLLGVSLPRDADQQFRFLTEAGKRLSPDETLMPGDLLYFGDQSEANISPRYAKVSHVALSLGGDRVLHATGAAWGVTVNSLDPDSAIYRAWLRQRLVGVCRP